MSFADIFWAFLEGLGLILSPCILPVLPFVLSASVEGGRRRPYGIITGFVLAFSIFVLGSRAIVNALHIDLDLIRYASMVLLFLFGLVLLSEKLSAGFSRLTQGAADLGNRVGTGAPGGFVSGVAVGALIGLVWTPCAGPLLASVLVQVISQKTDLQSVFVTFAFAVGAGMPMLIIALAGRKAMSHLKFFTEHAEAVRKFFGVIILLAVLVMAFGSNLFASGMVQGTDLAAEMQNPSGLKNGLAQPYPAPDFAGISDWLNSPPLTMAGLKGKVVLVDFWTYSCINCVRTLPYITSWWSKYHDKGLVIIGVHSPEFEFEKKVGNIKTALVKYGIDYPVAVDNDLATWQNFDNKYWPAHYLIDKNGQVVYTHFGEGRYDVTENNIRFLLGLTGKAESMPAPMQVNFKQTPETYLGTARAERYAGKPLPVPDAVTTYSLPDALPESSWALGGAWKIGDQKITAQEAGAVLRFHVNARKVFLVAGTASNKPMTLALKLNGRAVGDNAGKDAPGGVVTVNGHALYELIDQHNPADGLLEIDVNQPGVEMYAFTFGG